MNLSPKLTFSSLKFFCIGPNQLMKSTELAALAPLLIIPLAPAGLLMKLALRKDDN